MFSNKKEAAEYLSHYFRMLGRKQQMEDENPEFEVYTCDDCGAKFYWNTRNDHEVTYPCSADIYCSWKTVCPYGACWRTFEECGHSQYCRNEFSNDSFNIEYCEKCIGEIKLKIEKNRKLFGAAKLTLRKFLPIELGARILSNIIQTKFFTKDSIMNYKMYGPGVEFNEEDRSKCERKLSVYWYGISEEEHNRRYGI